jgi:hypothetical protein
MDSWNLILGSSAVTFHHYIWKYGAYLAYQFCAEGSLHGVSDLSIKLFFLAAGKPQCQRCNKKFFLMANLPEVITLTVKLIHSWVQNSEVAVACITCPTLVRMATLLRISSDSDTSYLMKYKINVKYIHGDHKSYM